jgi:hypothetical protein
MKAIFALYPEAVKTKYKSDTEMYAWDKDENKIELNLDAINNWVDPEAYKQARRDAYPSLPDQLDMQYHDTMNGTETWLDHINEVKAKYPKPTE